MLAVALVCSVVPGARVELHGLTSAAGRPLNGAHGVVEEPEGDVVAVDRQVETYKKSRTAVGKHLPNKPATAASVFRNST